MKRHHGAVLMALLGLLVLGAIGSASASAAACTKEAKSKKFALCIGGESIGTPTEAKSVSFTATSGFGEVSGFDTTVAISCSTVAVENGKIETAGGKSAKVKAGFTFSNCSFNEGLNTKCKVTQLTFPTPGQSLEGTFPSSAESLRFKPREAETYIGWLTIASVESCPSSLGREYHFVGELECSLSSSVETKQSPEVESVKKYLTCTENTLKDPPYNNAITLTIRQPAISLSEPYLGKKFSIIEGK